MFQQGKSPCGNHGGLLTYVHWNFSATVRKQFRKSLLWEDQLIDIKGESLITPISIFNIYPPSPPHPPALAVGDFNINLSQLNEREKYNDFIELMCTNSFYPKNKKINYVPDLQIKVVV